MPSPDQVNRFVCRRTCPAADRVDPRDEKFIPTKAVAENTTTTNEATGEQRSVVQAGTVNGGVEQHHHDHQHPHAPAGPAEPDLVSGRPTPEELAAAGDFFVERPGIGEAERRLRRHGVVLVDGDGTGGSSRRSACSRRSARPEWPS
jgi:hypothetical protein